MATTDPLVNLLQDSFDLSQVNVREIWELVAAFIENPVYNVILCCSELHSSRLILLDRQDPCGEVHHDWIHPAWPYIYGVYVHSLRVGGPWARRGTQF